MARAVQHSVGRIIAFALVFFSSAIAVYAQSLTPGQREAAIAFTIHNTHHVLLHEIGHLFVDQFDLPVLGKEEDAVDALATLVILQTDGAGALEVLADTIDGWLYSERSRTIRGYVNSDFYGEHSLDIQRSFAITCLMVGSDFDRFTNFATRVGLPIDRQERCSDDYRMASMGWSRLLDPHTRDGDFGAEIDVQYKDNARRFGDIARIFQQHAVLETAADWVRKTHVLEEPVLMTAEECGQVNAFYYPGARHIKLCYEWGAFFFDMFVDKILPEREHFAQMHKLKSEKLMLN